MSNPSTRRLSTDISLLLALVVLSMVANKARAGSEHFGPTAAELEKAYGVPQWREILPVSNEMRGESVMPRKLIGPTGSPDGLCWLKTKRQRGESPERYAKRISTNAASPPQYYISYDAEYSFDVDCVVREFGSGIFDLKGDPVADYTTYLASLYGERSCEDRYNDGMRISLAANAFWNRRPDLEITLSYLAYSCAKFSDEIWVIRGGEHRSNAVNRGAVFRSKIPIFLPRL